MPRFLVDFKPNIIYKNTKMQKAKNTFVYSCMVQALKEWDPAVLKTLLHLPLFLVNFFTPFLYTLKSFEPPRQRIKSK